ncbi:MAG TPA: hypothetical protein VM686_18550 [Polyangiaceae bacterium]|nr:hypothetical protein [Polyangiaceae bacterium]
MSITFRDPRNERTFGGTGGSHFNHAGPNPDHALVGLEIWSGDVVDAVAPIFAQLLPGGHLGPIHVGPKSGGPGGRPTTIYLPGQVLVGIWVHWGAVVDKVRLAFRAWTPTGVSGRETWSDIVGGLGGDQGPAEYLHESGRCAIAVHGKAGSPHDVFARLDSIGLVSAEPVIARAAVDEVPREVVRGRKSTTVLED